MSQGDYLNYFIAGVPPGIIFGMHAKELEELVNSDDSSEKNILKVVPRVCFIGLVAYFETFFKETAAAIINITPVCLQNLKKAGYNTSIDCADLSYFRYKLDGRIGSLITEDYDFGNAKKINNFFRTLFNRDVFSKKEMEQYGKVLADRNLIVHNGGTFNLKYLKQRNPKVIGNSAFFYSIDFAHREFADKLKFLMAVSHKINENVAMGMKKQLHEHPEDFPQNGSEAIDAFLWEY
jgi:hypothetical protein